MQNEQAAARALSNEQAAGQMSRQRV